MNLQAVHSLPFKSPMYQGSLKEKCVAEKRPDEATLGGGQILPGQPFRVPDKIFSAPSMLPFLPAFQALMQPLSAKSQVVVMLSQI